MACCDKCLFSESFETLYRIELPCCRRYLHALCIDRHKPNDCENDRKIECPECETVHEDKKVAFLVKTLAGRIVECSICSDSLFYDPLPDCNHSFHATCLAEYANAGHGDCPVCRRTLSLKESYLELAEHVHWHAVSHYLRKHRNGLYSRWMGKKTRQSLKRVCGVSPSSCPGFDDPNWTTERVADFLWKRTGSQLMRRLFIQTHRCGWECEGKRCLGRAKRGRPRRNQYIL